MMNQIKQGYKQTKVGVIPEDWEVVKLNEKSSIQRGRFSPRPRNDPQFYNGNYPFVQTNDVVNSKGKITTYSQTLNEKGLKVSKLFPQGTILMTIAANIGFTGILTRDMTCPDSLVGIQCKKGLFNEFLNFYFIFNQKRIDYLAEEAAQKNINLSTLNSFHIPLPPLKEQEKIADILTTWDEAISKQTELIKEKELLKKALMQKLLSSEVRFSGFSEEWEEVRIKDIFEFTRGYVLAVTKMSQEQTEKYRFPVYSSQTKNNGLTGYYKDYLFENCITWTTDGANAGDVNLRKGKFYCTNVCGVLKNDKGYANQCIAEILNLVTKNYVSYVGNPKLMNNTMGGIKIKIPKSILEQQKIAEVLSLSDDEIKLIKNELDELKLQKKALMQKLLTGEVRVGRFYYE